LCHSIDGRRLAAIKSAGPVYRMLRSIIRSITSLPPRLALPSYSIQPFQC
jgi:hypothetical protein